MVYSLRSSITIHDDLYVADPRERSIHSLWNNLNVGVDNIQISSRIDVLWDGNIQSRVVTRRRVRNRDSARIVIILFVPRREAKPLKKISRKKLRDTEDFRNVRFYTCLRVLVFLMPGRTSDIIMSSQKYISGMKKQHVSTYNEIIKITLYFNVSSNYWFTHDSSIVFPE